MKDLLENPSLEASLDDLKVIYRVLIAHAEDHPELNENAFMTSLERLLRAQAQVEGVDLSDDDSWEAWLRGDDFDEERNTTLLN